MDFEPAAVRCRHRCGSNVRCRHRCGSNVRCRHRCGSNVRCRHRCGSNKEVVEELGAHRHHGGHQLSRAALVDIGQVELALGEPGEEVDTHRPHQCDRERVVDQWVGLPAGHALARRRPSSPSRRRWTRRPSCRRRSGSSLAPLQHPADVLQLTEVADVFVVFVDRRQAVGGEQLLDAVPAELPAMIAQIRGGLIAVAEVNKLGEVEVEAVVAPPLPTRPACARSPSRDRRGRCWARFPPPPGCRAR